MSDNSENLHQPSPESLNETKSEDGSKVLPGSEPVRGSAYLRRSSTNKIIGGVAGGLGEYFAIDPTIIRVVFVLLFIFHGIGLLIYALLWLIMPSETGSALEHRDQVRTNVEEMGQSVREQVAKLQTDESRSWIGWLLIGLGVIFLLRQFGNIFWQILGVGQFWPLILVVIGLWLLVRRK